MLVAPEWRDIDFSPHRTVAIRSIVQRENSTPSRRMMKQYPGRTYTQWPPVGRAHCWPGPCTAVAADAETTIADLASLRLITDK